MDGLYTVMSGFSAPARVDAPSALLTLSLPSGQIFLPYGATQHQRPHGDGVLSHNFIICLFRGLKYVRLSPHQTKSSQNLEMPPAWVAHPPGSPACPGRLPRHSLQPPCDPESRPTLLLTSAQAALLPVSPHFCVEPSLGVSCVPTPASPVVSPSDN